MATRRHDELVGSDTVAERTGRPREEWHGLLDAAGATSWTHKQIADSLVTEHGVDGWWAQGITVGYEQARGMRLPGQRPDGTFDANASKTIARGAQEVFPHLAEDALRSAWLGEGWHVTTATAPKRVRLRSEDGSRAVLEVTAVSPVKTRVSVQHAKLPDPDTVAEKKTFWREALDRLAASLG